MKPIELTPEQAKDIPFPIGCIVWYNFPSPGDEERSRKVGSNGGNGRTATFTFRQLRRGVVVAVWMDFIKGLMYKVKGLTMDFSVGSEAGKTAEAAASGADGFEQDLILENDMAFGDGCPVFVTLDGDKENSVSPVEGTVRLVKPSEKESSQSTTKPGGSNDRFMYVVEIAVKRSQFRFEFVPADRIKYRRVVKPAKSKKQEMEEKITTDGNNATTLAASSSANIASASGTKRGISATIQNAGDGASTTPQTAHQPQQETNQEQRGNQKISSESTGKEPMYIIERNPPPGVPASDTVPSSLTFNSGNSATRNASNEKDFKPDGSHLANNKGTASTPAKSITSTVDALERKSTEGGRFADIDNALPSSRKKMRGISDSPSSAPRESFLETGDSTSASKHGISSYRGSNVGGSNRSNRVLFTVPMYLQESRNSKRDLFFHLVGNKNDPDGQKIKRMQQETNCYIRIDGFDNVNLSPMTIEVTAKNPATALSDVIMARKKLEDSFLEFVGRDGSRGRILYEIARAFFGPHRPNASSSNAVQQRNPFHNKDFPENNHFYMSLVELPSTVDGNGEKTFCGSYLLKSYVLSKVRNSGCFMKLCGKEFNVPVLFGDPYVLVLGRFYQQVDQAVDIIKDEIHRHKKNCTCSF